MFLKDLIVAYASLISCNLCLSFDCTMKMMIKTSVNRIHHVIDHFCPTSATYREQVSTNQHGQMLNGQLTVSYYDQFFPSRNKVHALVIIEGMTHTRMSNGHRTSTSVSDTTPQRRNTTTHPQR